MDKYIKEFNWDTLLSHDHLQLYEKFSEELNNIYQKAYRRVKLKKRKPDNQWINSHIMELCYQKEQLWKKCKSNPTNTALKEEFRTFRNMVTAKIKLAKRNYFIGKFDENKRNPRKQWDTLNHLMGRQKKSSIDEVIRKHFGEHENCVPLCEKFNEAFIKAIDDLKLKISAHSETTSSIHGPTNSAHLPEMDLEDLQEMVRKMSVQKPPGTDNIRQRDIYHNFNQLKEIILKILNGIFSTGKIPKPLKSAIVRPLYKQGPRNKCENYRPLSILPVISHYMEKHILKVMESFTDTYALIEDSQYGFRRGKSTIALLEDVSDVINSNLDSNQFVLMLFLDLKKAFETVDHGTMIKKLNDYGFRGHFELFFRDYFADRHQQVKIEDVKSKPIAIKYGLPQGSTISPILFNLYMNDINSLNLNSKIYQYADDTALILPHTDMAAALSNLQDDISKLVKWFDQNHIVINAAKTKLMCCRSPHKQINFSRDIFIHSDQCVNCKCPPLTPDKSVKYLGLYFDQHLNWRSHVEYLANRLRTVSAFIYQLRSGTDVGLRRKVFQALGESVLRYGITVYGTTTYSTKNIIDRIIRRTVKNISYGSKLQELRTEEQMSKLGILTLDQLFYNVALVKHYYTHNFRNIPQRERHLRTSEQYIIPRIYTNYGKRVRNYYVPNIFNALPQDLQQLSGIKTLRKKIREYSIRTLA